MQFGVILLVSRFSLLGIRMNEYDSCSSITVVLHVLLPAQFKSYIHINLYISFLIFYVDLRRFYGCCCFVDNFFVRIKQNLVREVEMFVVLFFRLRVWLRHKVTTYVESNDCMRPNMEINECLLLKKIHSGHIQTY